MKTVVLTKKTAGFNLNGLKMSATDLTLFMQLLGFDVPPGIEESQLFIKTLKSLPTLPYEEFSRAFHHFVMFDAQTKMRLQHKVAIREILETPLHQN